MAGTVVSVRVSQGQYDKINQLVVNGVFGSRSKVLQTFVDLGLEHCSLGEDAQVIGKALVDFRARAEVVARRAAVRNLAKSLIEELSWLIEAKQIYLIISAVNRTQRLAFSLSPDIFEQLMKMLEAEPVYQIAQQIVRGKE